MIPQQTQVNLALYIGETYCEIEALDQSGQSYYKKNIFLPQSSVKNILQACKADLDSKNLTVLNIYAVTRYLEKLKTFRLGGSVIQVLNAGFENSYTIEKSTNISLAATSLIIPLTQEIKTDSEKLEPYLREKFEKLKKINPDTDKVVIHLGSNDQCLPFISNFFDTLNFKVFTNSKPFDLTEIRKVLLNAGIQGTKDELFKEINEFFPTSQLQFWVKDQFTSTFENCDLYFSATDFLGYSFFEKNNSKVENQSHQIVHLDIENWIALKNEQKSHWKSPWGKIQRNHYAFENLSLHPLTEIYIDQNSLLQFSSHPSPSEPGPMVGGRGVKSLVLDIFLDEIKQNSVLSELFPMTNNSLSESKINSQFKVLEHGQKTEGKTFNKSDLKSLVQELIQFDCDRILTSSKTPFYTGHFNFILNKKNHFRWTALIFDQVGKQ